MSYMQVKWRAVFGLHVMAGGSSYRGAYNTKPYLPYKYSPTPKLAAKRSAYCIEHVYYDFKFFLLQLPSL
ncbi:hypothetical protein VN97_g11895 [Penicillium thymicola]|uniref:Uncharacterized protein n=1 Tax=Penicillium thymicola TaxID=293382 RepID=A0AAI9T7B8_PENTH|nr:hypothetical protein VN97_g11895 [Penicillium thymicola]